MGTRSPPTSPGKSANDIVDGLKALGVKRRGAIPSTSSTRCCRPGRTWPRISQATQPTPSSGTNLRRARAKSPTQRHLLTFLCLACLIAAVGVVTDSPVTVVGAMVVGPEFGPLAALAVALVRRRMSLARAPRPPCWSASRSRCSPRRPSGYWRGRPSAGTALETTRELFRGRLHLSGRSAVICGRVARRRRSACCRWCRRNRLRWSVFSSR